MARRGQKSGLLRKILIVLAIGAAIGLYFGYEAYHALYGSNVDLKNRKEAFVYIRSDDTFPQVMEQLKNSGYIENFETFEFIATRKKYERSVKPGKYRLIPGMSNNQVINMLRSGDQVPVRVKLNKEDNLAQIAGAIGSQLEADSTRLIALLTNPDTAAFYGFKPETFIAMFVPNTYEFYWATTPRKVLGRFADEYKKVWTPKRLEKAKELDMNPDEVTTLASIVAKETAKNSESRRIAGVYMNRLKTGIPLQADPTLRFAANDPTIQRVLNIHKAVDSPYNTYLHKGLPPGPIGMATAGFLDAVLDYEHHNYLYFCAREDFSGFSNFAVSYEQHQQNARRYQRALTERGIMN
ncbi:MAG: endolytic transglycosylase MltG [Bacteroidota bacterium]